MNRFTMRLRMSLMKSDALASTPSWLTVHSFTPVFDGRYRSVEIGYLHAEDDRLSRAMERLSTKISDYTIKLNEPYAPVDGVLHTIEKHLECGAFPYLMIEVRNDLLTDQKKRSDILSLFARCIPMAVASLVDRS